MSATDSLASAIKGAAGVAALAPGVAMLLGVVQTPPTAAQLTKALALAMGVVVVLIVLIARDRIERAERRRTVILCSVLLVAGIGFAFAYYEAGERYVIDYRNEGLEQRLIVPLFPSEELQEIVRGMGSYPEAVTSEIVGGRAVQLIDEQNDMTVPALILLVLLAQGCLLVAITVGAWKYATSLARVPAAPDPPPTQSS